MTVNAGGSGNISTAKNTNILSGTQSITLISGTGNIGSGTVSTTAITTKTPLLSANTGGSGVVNLSDSATGTLASSSSGGSFTLAGTGSVTIGKLSTTNGDINITAKGATLQTSAGSTITANNGALTLNNTNTAGKIIIGTNSTVQTQGIGGKDVKIVVGPIPAVGSNPPTAPANVVVSTSGGGNVFFGTNGITGPTTTPVAHVNAIGKNVIFSTNKAKASAITLGSGSTITADPPVIGGLVIRSAEFYSEPQSPDSAARANAKAIGVISPTSRGSFTELAAKNDSSSATYAIAAAASAPLQVNIAAFDSINPQAAQSYVATQKVVTNSTTAPGDSAPDSSYKYRSSSNLDSDSNRIVPAHLVTDIASEGELTMSTATKGNNPNSVSNANSKMLSGGVTKVSMPTCFNMKGESILFAPKQNMTVKTDMATIKVDAGSVVLVMEHGDGITVFNFDDAHRGAVEIVFEGKRIGVAPGRHCSLSFRSEFSEMNPAQTIPHRNMIVSKTTDGKVIFESEFSLPAAFDRVEPISSLMVSKHPHAKKLVGHMLKTAAVISQLNRSGVGFKQYTKPSITAFAGN